ncbi:hypothetical protein ACFFRR_006132 [Megaselia abdita]
MELMGLMDVWIDDCYYEIMERIQIFPSHSRQNDKGLKNVCKNYKHNCEDYVLLSLQIVKFITINKSLQSLEKHRLRRLCLSFNFAEEGAVFSLFVRIHILDLRAPPSTEIWNSDHKMCSLRAWKIKLRVFKMFCN